MQRVVPVQHEQEVAQRVSGHKLQHRKAETDGVDATHLSQGWHKDSCVESPGNV